MIEQRARVLVIGGGIAGCSLLYHITRLGWRDVVLVEKGELTSGSTWHAAGLCTQLNASLNVTKLLMTSMKLYRSLEAETGQAVSLHQNGSLRLATDPDRLDEFHHRLGIARYLGLEAAVVGPGEVRERWPLARVEDVLGALWTPSDGHVDPSSVTQALAAGARASGAAIHRHTRVLGIKRRADAWLVRTTRGDVEAEVVVNAAGQWAREVGAMVGVRLPIVPLQHQYVVTEAITDLHGRTTELPVLRDPDGSFDVREEGDGLLVGPFEPQPLTWAVELRPDRGSDARRRAARPGAHGRRREPGRRRLRLPRAGGEALGEGLPPLGCRHLGGLDAALGRTRAPRRVGQGRIQEACRAPAPAPPHGNEVVLHDGRVVSYVLSGGHGPTVGADLAFAYLPTELAAPGTQLAVEVLGETVGACVVADPLFDPENRRLRG